MIRRVSIVTLAVILFGGLAWGSSGDVIDPQGQPLAGAVVCYSVAGIDQLCVESDTEGHWDLPPSRIDAIRIRHEGHLPKEIRGGDHAEPIILQRAATLLIKLQDANGQPIEKGEIDILYSSGKRVGPFPISRASGTRVRTLEPGPIVVVGRSEGRGEGRAPESELRGGEETLVIVLFSSER